MKGRLPAAGMWRRTAFATTACLALVAVGIPAKSPKTIERCIPPLPYDFALAPVPDGVPAEIAVFHGIWGDGRWNNRLCHTLVVEVLNERGRVAILYSHGADVHRNIEAAYLPLFGEIVGGSLQLDPLPNGADVAYRLSGSILSGRYERDGSTSSVLLSRLDAVPPEADLQELPDCETPMPAALPAIVAPPGLHPDLARFLGVWGNSRWLNSGGQCHALVIDEIENDGDARVIFSAGGKKYWRMTARVSGNRIVLERPPDGALVEYYFVGDTLRGSYSRMDAKLTILLHRRL